MERSASLPARMNDFGLEIQDDTSLPIHKRLVRSASSVLDKSRSSRGRSFPPPLGCLARRETEYPNCPGQSVPWIRLEAIRTEGRIVLRPVKIANQMSLRCVRKNGRLILNLVPDANAAPAKAEKIVSQAAAEQPVVNTSVPAKEEETVPQAAAERLVDTVPQTATPEKPTTGISVSDSVPQLAPEKPEQDNSVPLEEILNESVKVVKPEQDTCVPVEETVNESVKVVNGLDKLREDHAHVLRELISAYANRRARMGVFPCKRDEDHRQMMWEQQHHFQCVTTSS